MMSGDAPRHTEEVQSKKRDFFVEILTLDISKTPPPGDTRCGFEGESGKN